MEKVVLLFLIIGVIVTGIVWLIDKFLKPKWLKYIFVLCLVILTIYFIAIAQSGTGEGFEDLANFIVAMFTFVGAVVSLITSIIFDVIKNKKSKKV